MNDPYTTWWGNMHEHHQNTTLAVDLSFKVSVDEQKTIPRMGFKEIKKPMPRIEVIDR